MVRDYRCVKSQIALSASCAIPRQFSYRTLQTLSVLSFDNPLSREKKCSPVINCHNEQNLLLLLASTNVNTVELNKQRDYDFRIQVCFRKLAMTKSTILDNDRVYVLHNIYVNIHELQQHCITVQVLFHPIHVYICSFC